MQIKKGRKEPMLATTELSRKLAAAVAAQSILYREVSAEREEIMRHKWFMSERAGYDVGYVRAMYDWVAKHRAAWRRAWRGNAGADKTQ